MPLDSNEYRAMVDAVAEGVQKGMNEAARTGGFAAGGSLRGARGDRMDPKDRAAQEKQRKVLADQSKTYRELVKQLKQNEISSEQLHEAVKVGNVVFDRAIEQGFKTSKMFGTLGGSLDKLPKAFSYAIRTSGSDMATELAGSVASLEEVFIAQQKFDDLPHVADLMDEFAKGEINLRDMNLKIQELGFSAKETESFLEDFGEITDGSTMLIKKGDTARKQAQGTIGKFRGEVLKTQKAVAQLGKSQKGNLGPLAAAKDKLEDLTIAGFSVGKAFAAVSAVILGYIKVLTDATSSTMKYGTTLQMWDAAVMGMNMGELAEMQSRYRNVIMSSGGSLSDFNEQIKSSNAALFEYTGNLAESSRVAAHMMEANKRLGGSAATQGKFMDDQTAMLHTMNKVLGMTSEQFRELNNEIINSVDVRASLFKLDKSVRQQKFQEIQQNVVNFRLQGMLENQAKQLAMHFEKMRGEDPMERIKRAFRTRALMGAIGAEGGAQVSRAIIAGPRAAAMGLGGVEESGALRTQQALQQTMATGLGGELFGSMLVGKLQLGETFGAKGAMVDAVLEQGNAAKEGARQQLEQTKMISGLTVDQNKLIMTGLIFQAQAVEHLKTGGLSALGLGPELLKKMQSLGIVEGPAGTVIQSPSALGNISGGDAEENARVIRQNAEIGSNLAQKAAADAQKQLQIGEVGNKQRAEALELQKQAVAANTKLVQLISRQRATGTKSPTGGQDIAGGGPRGIWF